MPVLMFAAIVLTANHYIFDGVAGGALALLGLFAATRLSRRGMPRTSGRRRRASPGVGSGE
ncbi:phosphatase PAP2 family protein [Kribbella speibonae]|uniref:Inositolphosphotransferase Aur1/Ipt1 domain-containing protein n=1 Tax=Kribbella speibonae TaxID=1572660 RepID=A0A4R0IC77_9ACTN|nr:hypothetical protein E0H92_37050 [Kribbella speibonae]